MYIMEKPVDKKSWYKEPNVYTDSHETAIYIVATNDHTYTSWKKIVFAIRDASVSRHHGGIN